MFLDLAEPEGILLHVPCKVGILSGFLVMEKLVSQ